MTTKKPSETFGDIDPILFDVIELIENNKLLIEQTNKELDELIEKAREKNERLL